MTSVLVLGQFSLFENREVMQSKRLLRYHRQSGGGMQRFFCTATLCFALCFLFLVPPAYAQDAAQYNDDSTSEVHLSLKDNTEAALPLAEEREVLVSGRTSMSAVLVQLIVSLVAVCAVIYGVLFLIKRSKQFRAGNDPFLKTVAVLPLAPDKTVYVVSLVDKAYLLGASSSSLSFLAEITDKELIDAMNLNADQQEDAPRQDFASLLYTFFPAVKPKKNDGSPFDSFLSKQRERLQKNGTIHGEEDGEQ